MPETNYQSLNLKQIICYQVSKHYPLFIEVKNLLIDLRDKCVNYVTIDISVVMKSHLLFETLSSNRRRL